MQLQQAPVDTGFPTPASGCTRDGMHANTKVADLPIERRTNACSVAPEPVSFQFSRPGSNIEEIKQAGDIAVRLSRPIVVGIVASPVKEKPEVELLFAWRWYFQIHIEPR
ncbi:MULTISPECIES: hypothetical protein [Ralstonia solanacearum species complex]|uniref:hypothetical protein n=1 Tax=Ralstonia solanacearum species complex TaxID=3116862 RepID=UPI002B317382|nr:hypothetical protein MAFF211271_33500 [Ralstonia pseudosolanacearum]